jgi:hypothetical protein
MNHKAASIIVLVTVLIAVTGLAASATQAGVPLQQTLQAGASPPDAQSTTGPHPPAGVSVAGALLDSAAAPLIIPGVPTYVWHHGCGPTAAGMVIGHWDGLGYDALVPGDASTQTAAVNEMIASEGPASNYTDYCLPIDSYPDLFPDLSELPAGDEHADECVADYMDTSQSVRSNRYGWSWFSDVSIALEAYTRQALGPEPYVITEKLYGIWEGGLSWDRFRAEMDAGRPMVLLVDTNGDGGTDHFVTAVGYDLIGGEPHYACLNTWDHGVHWFEFASIASGQTWGIFGGVTFRIVSFDHQIFCPLINRDS